MEAPFERQAKYYPMAHGFFIVVFGNIEDKKAICGVGLWFWGSDGLFMQPWTPTLT